MPIKIKQMEHRHFDVAYRLALEEDMGNFRVKNAVKRYCKHRHMTSREKREVQAFIKGFKAMPAPAVNPLPRHWSHHQVQYFMALTHLWDHKASYMFYVPTPSGKDKILLYKFKENGTLSHDVKPLRARMSADGSYVFVYAEFPADTNVIAISNF